MDDAATRDMPIGDALEDAMRWALPASPLFLAILMMLAHAPYATPIVSPAAFFLACMVGAGGGLAACALVGPWTPKLSLVLCAGGGVVLEAAWLVLLVAEKSMASTALLIGSWMAGLSSAVLLVLWLWVGQTPSLTCELAKLAAVFAIAYALYTLFSVIPHGGAVSYLFPVVTCVPLGVNLRAHAPQATPARGASRSTPGLGGVQLGAAFALLASFGAGFVALGFGGALVEQGAGLLSLVLVASLALFPRRIDLVRLVAVPLVVFSLCYEALAGHGNAFAFFLAGCGSLAIWFYLHFRFEQGDHSPAGPRDIALRILFAAAAAATGMLAGQLAFTTWHLQAPDSLFVLIAAVMLTDFGCRLSTLRHLSPTSDALVVPASPAQAAQAAAAKPATPQAPGPSEPRPALLERLFGLSPREVQVAELLCESRSASYISQKLGMADSTTKTHIRHVYEKADVHSRSELQLLVDGLATNAVP